ncbi:MAG: hypothetical protein ACRC2K_09765 [Clostridium sp.]
MVNIDYTLFFYIMIVLPIILTISMLLVNTLIEKRNFKKDNFQFKSNITLEFFKELNIEDYFSFEKYEIWHFTEHKELPSRI